MNSIILDGKMLLVQFKRNTRAKKYIMRVSEDVVFVTIPQGGSSNQAIKFVEKNKSWLEENFKKQNKFFNTQLNVPAQCELLKSSFIKIFLEGKYQNLYIEPQENITEPCLKKIQTPNKEQMIYFIYPKYCKAKINKILKFALKKFLLDKVDKMIKRWEPHLSAKPEKIVIKTQRTLWGSCSSKKHISLNLSLVCTTDRVLEYVFIHEVCHLKHMNHSKDFWDAVRSFIPEYKEYEKWLREHFWLIPYLKKVLK